MARLPTYEGDPLPDSLERMELALEQQRKADSVQSVIAAVVVIGILAGILYLFSVLPGFQTADVIVSYQLPEPEENPVDRPDMAIGLKPKPTNASSSMARVIAASVEAPVAVPMPEESNPTTLFGIDDDFEAGFGIGDGEGDGGGGSSFFGTPRKGKRVVYIVDFSESMKSGASGGGTRLDAAKKELIRSIQALKEGTVFNVIFFAHTAWTIETEGPNHADKGWNGLNAPPETGWHPATPQVKAAFSRLIREMGTGRGTVWYSPLKLAFSLTPGPDTVYMLSDGEPSDLNNTLIEVGGMNPSSIPVDTIALETPGSAAMAMSDLAKETGGKFTLIYQGKALRGRMAEPYLHDDSE